MERTEFQQTMADLREKNERRRYDALRKKYETAPDFTNMSLRDEIGTRYDLDELEQLNKKFGVPNGSIYNGPNCHMSFDGQNLNLYKDGIKLGRLDAQSGKNEYQSAQYQNVKDKGPIPEGTYYADQNGRQTIDMVNMLAGIPRMGNWKGSVSSWGIRRFWLRPDKNNQMYGRDGFSIHGGWEKGSAGCIDIPGQTGKLSDYMDECQDSVPVYVKYPERW